MGYLRNAAIGTFGALLFGVMAAGSAQAALLSFTPVTNNSAINAGTAGQYSVDVTQSGLNTLFKFSNSGPAASSITDIYFDDTSPFALSNNFTFTHSSGVDFSKYASPSNLPGGNVISFTADFSADSDSPVQPNGINPTEWLTISFANASYNDVLNHLNSGALRIGIHVQGFANGGSESFVSTLPQQPVAVPEPLTMALLSTGLLGLGLARRRKA